MKVLEVQHWGSDGHLLWEEKNILNLLHLDGEEFILRAAFTDASTIPAFYYLGLDNRLTIAADDTMDDLIGEPVAGGYERSEISSTGDFSINFESSHYIATSPIVAFRSTTGTWGPCSNLFLATTLNDTGKLISTATLSSSVSLSPGEIVTMRIGMKLRDCPE